MSPIPEIECQHCGAVISSALRTCLACNADCGFPNVRECSSEDERLELNRRFRSAELEANTNGTGAEFNAIQEQVAEGSGVVVAMPASIARNLFISPRNLYANYEALVGANVLSPSDPATERERLGSASLIFGSYADEMRYGVLSLTTEGAPNYGDIYCRLRSVSISDRVNFLENDSFVFIDKHSLAPGIQIP